MCSSIPTPEWQPMDTAPCHDNVILLRYQDVTVRGEFHSRDWRKRPRYRFDWRPKDSCGHYHGSSHGSNWLVKSARHFGGWRPYPLPEQTYPSLPRIIGYRLPSQFPGMGVPPNQPMLPVFNRRLKPPPR